MTSPQVMKSWALRGYQIRDDDGRGQHVATYMRTAAEGHLMAAAPELLAACEHMLMNVGLGLSEDDPNVVKMQAAVAKARGYTRP